nr:replication factor A protein 1-like [Ipomoea batatas]
MNEIGSRKSRGPAGNLRELNDGREREGSDAVDLSLRRYHVRPHFRLDVSGNGGGDNGGCNRSGQARRYPRDAEGQLDDFSHLLFPAWPPRQREPTTPLAAVEGEESEGSSEALPNEEESSPLLAIFIRREPTTPSAALFIAKASPEKCIYTTETFSSGLHSHLLNRIDIETVSNLAFYYGISAKTEHLSKLDSAFPVFKINTDQQLLKQHCPEILGIPEEEVNTEMLSLEDDEILEVNPIATLPPLSGEAAEGSVKRSLIDEFSSTQGCRKVKQHRVKVEKID